MKINDSQDDEVGDIREFLDEDDDQFFTIGEHEFSFDEFNEYSYFMIHYSLFGLLDGLYTKETQPNKILDIIIKQTNGLVM